MDSFQFSRKKRISSAFQHNKCHQSRAKQRQHAVLRKGGGVIVRRKKNGLHGNFAETEGSPAEQVTCSGAAAARDEKPAPREIPPTYRGILQMHTNPSKGEQCRRFGQTAAGCEEFRQGADFKDCAAASLQTHGGNSGHSGDIFPYTAEQFPENRCHSREQENHRADFHHRRRAAFHSGREVCGKYAHLPVLGHSASTEQPEREQEIREDDGEHHDKGDNLRNFCIFANQSQQKCRPTAETAAQQAVALCLWQVFALLELREELYADRISGKLRKQPYQEKNPIRAQEFPAQSMNRTRGCIEQSCPDAERGKHRKEIE